MATTIAITVPPEYGYVILVATTTFFVDMWHGIRVALFRKPAGIAYPKAFADSGDLASAKSPEDKQAMYLFNCAQRAHYNWIENRTPFLLSLLLSGLKYPNAAAGLGAAWLVSRIMYAVGYTRADRTGGKGRSVGTWFFLVQVVLYGMAGWTGYKMVQK